MPHHVTMTMSEFRVLNAIAGFLVILVLLSIVTALKGGKRTQQSRLQHSTQQKRRTQPMVKRIGRTASRGSRWAAGVLFWYIAYPLVYPLAAFVGSRRGALVRSDLETLQRLARTHNHRCGHPVCVPFLLWPQWFVRCRACHKWVQLREMPTVDGAGIELMYVRGSLERDACPRRYVSSRPTPAQAAPSSPPVHPAPPAPQIVASQEHSKTA